MTFVGDNGDESCDFVAVRGPSAAAFLRCMAMALGLGTRDLRAAKLSVIGELVDIAQQMIGGARSKTFSRRSKDKKPMPRDSAVSLECRGFFVRCLVPRAETIYVEATEANIKWLTEELRVDSHKGQQAKEQAKPKAEDQETL